jgi:hypothetical protein
MLDTAPVLSLVATGAPPLWQAVASSAAPAVMAIVAMWRVGRADRFDVVRSQPYTYIAPLFSRRGLVPDARGCIRWLSEDFGKV